MENSGIINIANGHRFLWLRSNDGEIYGSVQTPECRPVKGSGGYWRTEDPVAASKIAEGRL